MAQVTSGRQNKAFVTKGSAKRFIVDGAGSGVKSGAGKGLGAGTAGYGDMTGGAKAKNPKSPKVMDRKSDGKSGDKIDSGQDGGGKKPMVTKGSGRHLPRDPGSVGGSDGALASEESLFEACKAKRY